MLNNTDEYYGDNMYGWLMPPVTGDYTFWISSDDNGEFFLNTNYGNVGAVYMMRICQTPKRLSKEQKSTPIPLVAGQPSYFEVS